MNSLVLAQENGIWQPMLLKDGFLGLTQFYFEPVYLQNGDLYLVERYMFNERILRVSSEVLYFQDYIRSIPYYPIVEVFPYRPDIARPIYISPTTEIYNGELASFKYAWAKHLDFLNTQKLRLMELMHWSHVNARNYNLAPYVLSLPYELNNTQVYQAQISLPPTESATKQAEPEEHTTPISLDLDKASEALTIDFDVELVGHKAEAEFTPVYNRKSKSKSPRPKSPFVPAELKPKVSFLQLINIDEQDPEANDESTVNINKLVVEEMPQEIVIPDDLIAKICDLYAQKLQIKSDPHLYNELESFVASGADINKPDKFKQSLLDYAVQFKNLKAARELVEEFFALANPRMLDEFKSASDAESYTMLFYLFHLVFINNKNRLNLALYRLEQMQPRPPVEMSLLMVQFLIANGADINCMTSANQHLLHSAAIRADYEVIEYLLEIMHKSDVAKYINHQDDFGQTALFAAIGRREPKIVKLLLKYGADPQIATLKKTKPIDRLRQQLAKSGKKPERCDFEIAQDLGEALLTCPAPKSNIKIS